MHHLPLKQDRGAVREEDGLPQQLPQAQEANIELLEKYADKNDEYLNSLPPLEYESRYMPNLVKGSIDKKAVFCIENRLF